METTIKLTKTERELKANICDNMGMASSFQKRGFTDELHRIIDQFGEAVEQDPDGQLQVASRALYNKTVADLQGSATTEAQSAAVAGLVSFLDNSGLSFYWRLGWLSNFFEKDILVEAMHIDSTAQALGSFVEARYAFLCSAGQVFDIATWL
ncbi:MAG: hypothetical protein KDC44_18885 [Phaeodactylibacter sp.]|nr:hypothetical protein [Phaeodactylibacter sp.]